MAELNDVQLARLDEIDNATQTYIESLVQTDVEWDMRLIGNIKDAAIDILSAHGYDIEHPFNEVDVSVKYSMTIVNRLK